MKTYCPYCRKDVDYTIEKRNIKKFKKIEINTYENVAVCNICKNDLYVSKIEDENNKRIYELYRKKANIISSKDIINLREKYNISQRELTSILEFGKMTINRYERGGVPTKSQSDYIKLLIENEDKFIEKAKEAYNKGNISERTYEKIISSKTEGENSLKKIKNIFRNYLNMKLTRTPDIYNGYKEFDLELIENIISYIASKVNNFTITSMNKYLWYIDCLSFKKRTISITGLTYEHEKYGPTIVEQEYNHILFLNDKYFVEYIENESGTTAKIVSNNNYDLGCLNNDDIKIINTIIKLLKNKNVSEISEISHKENGWKKTKRYEKISFDYAMELNLI